MFYDRAWRIPRPTWWNAKANTGFQGHHGDYKETPTEEGSVTSGHVQEPQSYAGRQQNALLIGHICLLIVYTFIFSLFVLRPVSQKTSIVEKTSLYSPAQAAIGSYSTIAIDGTVTRNDSKWSIISKFAGQPSAELDAAWNGLTPPSIPRIRLTKDELLRAGYTLDDAFFFKDGDLTAILNVHHQLHCLNAIRKMTYIDYYTATGEHKSHALARDHVDHCIEMLRQTLVCYADISVVPYIQDQHGNVRPDFDVVQQCRDYDRIQQWNWENVDYRPLPT